MMKKILFLPIVFFLGFTLPGDDLNIVRGDDSEKVFYFTFDCHDDDENVDYILETLKHYSVKGTFFLTGHFIRRFPDKTRSIAGAGHTVGNHSLTHPYFTDAEEVKYELQKTARLYTMITGQTMAPLWRAPYLQHLGEKWVLDAGESAGYLHIDVGLAVVDWVTENDPRYLPNRLFLDIFTGRINFRKYTRVHLDAGWKSYHLPDPEPNYSGVISLMHGGSYRGDGKDYVFCLEPMIEHLRSLGYRFGTCNELLPP